MNLKKITILAAITALSPFVFTQGTAWVSRAFPNWAWRCGTEQMRLIALTGVAKSIQAGSSVSGTLATLGEEGIRRDQTAGIVNLPVGDRVGNAGISSQYEGDTIIAISVYD